MSAATITLAKIEDHSGEGVCRECGREGLRWVATLSDGTRVGLECAKRVMGWKPAPKSYTWVAAYRIIAEHDDYGNAWQLWQHRTGSRTVATMGGSLHIEGYAREEWIKRGWL